MNLNEDFNFSKVKRRFRYLSNGEVQERDSLHIVAQFRFAFETIFPWLIFVEAYAWQSCFVDLCPNFEFKLILSYLVSVSTTGSIFTPTGHSANHRITGRKHARKDYFAVHCFASHLLVTDRYVFGMHSRTSIFRLSALSLLNLVDTL